MINKKSEVGKTNIISREGELAITRDSRFQITLFCSFDAKGVATAFFRSLQEVPLNASSFNTFQYALRLYRSPEYKDWFKLAALIKPHLVLYRKRSTIYHLFNKKWHSFSRCVTRRHVLRK